jgi:hypothetical protein
MNTDGSCYKALVENSLIKLDYHSKEIFKSKIIITKSTIPT